MIKKIKYRMRHYNWECPACKAQGTFETDVVITTRPKCGTCGKRKVEWTSIVEFGQKKEAKENEPLKEVKRKK